MRDTKITSKAQLRPSRRKDVTLAWNEPRAASFIGENVPAEHLMYVLEINPPLDKNGDAEEDNITMMPACALDGKTCEFSPGESSLHKSLCGNLQKAAMVTKTLL